MLIAAENPGGRSDNDDKGTITKNGMIATITIDAGKSRKISDHLFGIFFEDLNYAADGGLYAVRQISEKPIPFEIKLRNKKGDLFGAEAFTIDSKDWKKYTTTFTATQSSDSCSFVILAKSKGKFALDVVSLFPQKTFKNRTNGLRADLAQTIADLKPKFMRFPGGCLVHGDGPAIST
jgi:alpha-L-arabinofuranosidase